VHRRVGLPGIGLGIRHNGRVSTGKRGASGRHAGPARLEAPAPPPGSGKGSQLLLALGVTAAMVAWGYLVYLAIDFGTSARDGDGVGWVFLGLATLGAIACLFVALTLGTRLLQRVRANRPPPAPPRAPGGRRAAR
jgi:hypothetical protein